MKKAPLLLLALAQLTCASSPMTASPGTTLTIFANPEFIVANGGVSVISVLVVEGGSVSASPGSGTATTGASGSGTLVPDGTVVQFFTNLGQIDPQGETKDGVARVNLVAGNLSGTATVTATSGAANQATKDVVIGSARPTLVIVTANPTQLFAVPGNRNSAIVASVFDENGNPVANVPVILTLDQDATFESLESGSQPLFTDTNGQVKDVLHTRRPLTFPQTNVVVTANLTIGNPLKGSVTVTIN